MLRHRYGSPTAFAVSCLGKEKNKIIKIFGFSLSMSIDSNILIVLLNNDIWSYALRLLVLRRFG